MSKQLKNRPNLRRTQSRLFPTLDQRVPPIQAPDAPFKVPRTTRYRDDCAPIPLVLPPGPAPGPAPMPPPTPVVSDEQTVPPPKNQGTFYTPLEQALILCHQHHYIKSFCLPGPNYDGAYQIIANAGFFDPKDDYYYYMFFLQLQKLTLK